MVTFIYFLANLSLHTSTILNLGVMVSLGVFLLCQGGFYSYDFDIKTGNYKEEPVEVTFTKSKL